MMAAIEAILQGLHGVAAENHIAISNVALSMVGNVVDLTDPRRQTLNATDAEGRSVETSTQFITKPKLVADVLVLPGFAFVSSTKTYENLDVVKPRPTFAMHHYAGSWKNDHGGEDV